VTPTERRGDNTFPAQTVKGFDESRVRDHNVGMSEKKSPFSELSQLGNEALNLLKSAKRAAEKSGVTDKALEIVNASAKELERAVTNVASAAETEWKKHTQKPKSEAPPAGEAAEKEATTESTNDLGGGI
jgi:hypothetical protein